MKRGSLRNMLPSVHRFLSSLDASTRQQTKLKPLLHPMEMK